MKSFVPCGLLVLLLAGCDRDGNPITERIFAAERAAAVVGTWVYEGGGAPGDPYIGSGVHVADTLRLRLDESGVWVRVHQDPQDPATLQSTSLQVGWQPVDPDFPGGGRWELISVFNVCPPEALCGVGPWEGEIDREGRLLLSPAWSIPGAPRYTRIYRKVPFR